MENTEVRLNHFDLSEFSCKCGCGFNNIEEKFARTLDVARDLAGTSFVITSGCRCEHHNREVGGKQESSHPKGCACDISAFDSVKRFLVLKGLVMAGFTRIGIGREFVHVDDDREKPQGVIWLY